MKIKEAKEQSIVKRYGGYRSFVARECLERWGSVPNWKVDKKAPHLPVIVTYSNWAVRCDVCKDAFVIDWGEPYYCPTCLNAEYGGMARVVDYPEDKAEIERVLLKRNNPNNRNMRQGEMFQDLKDENTAHGLED